MVVRGEAFGEDATERAVVVVVAVETRRDGVSGGGSRSRACFSLSACSNWRIVSRILGICSSNTAIDGGWTRASCKHW